MHLIGLCEVQVWRLGWCGWSEFFARSNALTYLDRVNERGLGALGSGEWRVVHDRSNVSAYLDRVNKIGLGWRGSLWTE